MYSDNFMTQSYIMYPEHASGNTKCGVVFLDTSCILRGMEWYKKARRLMTQKKIRQEDLLDVFGVTTRGAVGHYLSGRRQPDPIQIKALAERLECSLDELLNDNQPDPLQIQIHKIVRSADKAMATTSHEFTEEERLRIYRVAFAAGLDMSITDEQLAAYLSEFVKK